MRLQLCDCAAGGADVVVIDDGAVVLSAPHIVAESREAVTKNRPLRRRAADAADESAVRIVNGERT